MGSVQTFCPWCRMGEPRHGFYCSGDSGTCFATVMEGDWGSAGYRCFCCTQFSADNGGLLMPPFADQAEVVHPLYAVCMACRKEGNDMGIPAQTIQDDLHGPYIKLGTLVYRPQPSKLADGVDVTFFNKKRQAAGTTQFGHGGTFDVAQTKVGAANYLLVHTKATLYGPTGRRELWCCHGTDWTPLHEDTPTPKGKVIKLEMATDDQVVHGIVIPAKLVGASATIQGWIRSNIPRPKGEKKQSAPKGPTPLKTRTSQLLQAQRAPRSTRHHE